MVSGSGCNVPWMALGLGIYLLSDMVHVPCTVDFLTNLLYNRVFMDAIMFYLISGTFLIALWVVLFMLFDETVLKNYFKKKLQAKLGIE